MTRLVLWLVLAVANLCYGCWKEERIGLLELKASVSHPYRKSLSSWIDSMGQNTTTDCCRWEAIECNTTTRRVTSISLSRVNDGRFGDWYLNASTFLAFQSLRSLELPFNSIGGCVEKEGFGKLSRLNNLEFLDLSLNNFNNGIISSLNGLSSIKALNLSKNKLNGSIRLQGLTNLRELDLSWNYLHSFLIADQGFANVPSWRGSLEMLDLSYNNFNNSIISSLNRLSSLKTLNFGSNNLNGSIYMQDFEELTNLKELDLSGNNLDNNLSADQGLCELKNLQVLNLWNNNLKGELHACLANLTSLELLDIASNGFTGNIGLSPLSNLTSLRYLILSHNHFQVPISFGSFFNHSNLEFIESLNNELVVETEQQTLSVPSFQLLGLRLSNCISCNLSNKGILIPSFLYHQHHLQRLELSRINFSCPFPSWLLENNRGLETLIVSNNSLNSGLSHFPSLPHLKLLALDVSNNHFDNPILDKIAFAFPGLKYLNVSSNGLGGEIPASLGNMSSLKVLDLSNNGLSGDIPEQLVTGCFSLEILKLSNNRMQGPLFPRNNNLTRLQALYLDNNHFSEITHSLYDSRGLVVLNVSQNHLSGNVPGWMGSMLPYLEEIDMSSNHLEGSIPAEFCQLDYLEILDLSDNNISGTIPPCFNPQLLVLLQLSKNKLEGSLSHELFINSSQLRVLDLSHNQLSGKVPDWVGSLSELNIMQLKDNRFEGEIPINLCHLSKLRMIDLSSNHFSGSIPPCFNNFTLEGPPGFTSTFLRGFYITYLDFTPFFRGLHVTPVTDYLRITLLDPEASFTTKGFSASYKGKILGLFSIIDLSCNNLIGPIPPQIGYLSQIHALNLSHNALTGPIPPTFSNLHSIESLDLSYNKLTGNIPLQLTQLNFLAIFNVSYNNLSGTIPDRGQMMAGQFGTFENSSYLGNPLLVRARATLCNGTIQSGDEGFSDMRVFYMSFAGSFVTFFLGAIAVLQINPRWGQACFYYTKQFTTTSYYFIVDNFSKLFCHIRRSM